MNKRAKYAHLGVPLVLALACLQGPAAVAQQPASQPRASLIEQIVVTATRRETTLQDTGIAVSAFDQSMLDAMNINQITDVQLAVPNLHFTKTNFSGSSLSIRGIGNNVIATSGDGGVGIHFNGAYLQNSSIFESEFFDVERVEILRGPQGTLYGRNTTGGAVNIIPARAHSDGFEAAINAEIGNYSTRKASGMVNIPLNDQLALRFSGMLLDRDGFAENTFTGNDIDDRDLWSFRIAANWELTDSTDAQLYWQRFRESDRRMRTSNQTCVKDTRTFPFSLGCLPNQDIESFEVLSSQGQLGGILFGFLPAIEAGVTYLPPFTDAYADTVRPADLRTVATPLDPRYRFDEDIVNLHVTHNLDDYTVFISGSYQESKLFSQTDYAWNVPSQTFNPNVSFDALFGLEPGTTGLGFTDASGVLTTPSDPTVSGLDFPFAYDESAFDTRTWTFETQLQSAWTDSPWDFLLGVFYMDHKTKEGYYDVRFNLAAALTPIERSEDGAPLAFFRSDTRPYELETAAVFSEVYYDLTDNTRLTGGLRYTWEKKSLQDRQSLLNTVELPEIPGVSNRAFLDDSLAAFLAPAGIEDRIFHGFGIGGNNPVPSFRPFSETWSEVTGKLAIEHNMNLDWTDETLLHLTLARSYKSGGINPPSFTGAFQETFDPEYINSIEVGAKNRLLGGAMQANFTAFFYDYDGLQTTKIIDRTSVNENIDAEIMGMELELSWFATDRLRLDAFVSFLDTKITGGESLNPADPTNSDPNWITVKNTGADVFIAPAPGSGQTFDPSMCGQTLECATVFETLPLDAEGNALDTLPNELLVPIGIPAQLSGNRLVNAPKWSAKLGAQYSFPLANGWELVPRVDWYWQDKFFYRIYNSRQDRIDSWTVMNAAVSLRGPDDRWYVEAFVKNLRDKDHITGAYFTDYSSANFTNVFLLEPRTYGLQFGARF
jgi:iron complex outermembrane receptor protein